MCQILVNFCTDFFSFGKCSGEYEYIDVIVEGERVLIDVDFRSEFEVARSTSSYKAVLQLLPFIFVGKSDRLLQIVSIASEAARQSLKKKGMHIAPWRNAEYIKAKWLSPHTRTTLPATTSTDTANKTATVTDAVAEPEAKAKAESEVKEEKVAEEVESKEISDSEFGELELIFGEKSSYETKSLTLLSSPPPGNFSGSEEEKPVQPVMMTWEPPALKPKNCERGNKVVVPGLASLLMEKP